MIEFKNTTTKANFKKYIEFAEQKIQLLPTETKGACIWKITDRFNNMWEVHFYGTVNEFTVYNKNPQNDTIVFALYISIWGDMCAIYKAVEINGDKKRKIQADKFLRKYEQLTLNISNYLRFGYLN